MKMSISKPIRSRFPKTSLKAANLIRVGKTVGILRDAIDDDVEYLLYHFRSKPQPTFEEFDNVWNDLHFSLVHFACVKRDYREQYMNAFHSSVLDHFRSPSAVIKTGVIFMLYFLHISQPKIWGKNRIRVSADTWKLLFDFYSESVLNQVNIEATVIFNKLRELGAFMFVQEEKLNGYFLPEKIEFERAIKMLDALQKIKMKSIEGEAVDLCMNTNLQELDKIASEYQSIKRETFCTPQASIATQRNLKETLNVTENRPRLLQNVLLNSTLANDETETVKQITHINQQMWNSKRRKLEQESSSYQKKKL